MSSCLVVLACLSGCLVVWLPGCLVVRLPETYNTVIERLVIVARSEVGTEHIAAPEGAREFSQPEDGADR